MILRLISAYLEENRKEAGMNMRRTGSFCYFISIRFFGELCTPRKLYTRLLERFLPPYGLKFNAIVSGFNTN